MKKLKFFLVMLFSLFFIHENVLLASSFQGNQNVTISTEVFENLYLAGGNIIIDAPVRGDLVCAGGDVIIQDSISEDVLLAGGTLKIMAPIGDDLRVGGGTIIITNNIDGDLVIAGGDVTIGKEATINGNLFLAGGTLKMNGRVKGKVTIRGGEVIWNGVAEKDFSSKAGSLVLNGIIQGKSELAAQKITFGNNTKLYGDVEYWNSEGDLNFENVLLSDATASYNTDLKVYESDFNWRYLGVGILMFWVYRLLAAAVMIALLIWMFHRFFSRNSKETSQNYATHLVYGMLYIIGLPVLTVLAFVTVIGIPVGFIMMGLYGMTLALGSILASLLIAYGLNNYLRKGWNRRQLFLVALCSFLALKLLGAIPLLGFFISIFIVTTAFGTILYIWWKNKNADYPETIVD